MTFTRRPNPTDDLRAAHEELRAAEEALTAVCRRAAKREAGAAAVNATQHRLHVALERVRRLEAAADEPGDAA